MSAADPAGARYRALLKRDGRRWHPAGVAYEAESGVFLFLPTGRNPKDLAVRSLDDLGPDQLPDASSSAGTTGWKWDQARPWPGSQDDLLPIDILERELDGTALSARTPGTVPRPFSPYAVLATVLVVTLGALLVQYGLVRSRLDRADEAVTSLDKRLQEIQHPDSPVLAAGRSSTCAELLVSAHEDPDEVFLRHVVDSRLSWVKTVLDAKPKVSDLRQAVEAYCLAADATLPILGRMLCSGG